MKFLTNIDLTKNQLLNSVAQNLATDPTLVNSVVGQFIYNTGSNEFKYYNGTEWVAIGGTPSLQQVLDVGSSGAITTSFTVNTLDAITLSSVTNTTISSSATMSLSGGTDLVLSAGTGDIKFSSYGGGTFDSTYVSILAAQSDGTVAEVDPSSLIEVSTLQEVTDEGNTTTNSILIDTGATGLAFKVRGEIDGLGEDLLSVSHDSVVIEPSTTFNQEVYADGVTSKTLAVPFVITSTGGLRLPSGTTAQRPSSPNLGLFRYNSTSKRIEGYQSISSSATNADKWFDVPMQISDSTASTDTLVIAPSLITDAANITTAGTAGTIQHDGSNVLLNDTLKLAKYGTNTQLSGTIKYLLAVDNTGNVIESTVEALQTGFVKLVEADQTITGNLTIDGDFTVTGANVLTAPETVVVEDNLLYLNSNWVGGTAPTQDAGFLINRGLVTEAGEDTVGLVWNETDNIFVFGSYGTEDGTGTNLTHNTRVNILAADAEFSGLKINTATTEIASPSSTDEVLVRDSSTGEVKHINFSEFGSVNRATGTIAGDDSATDYVISHNFGVQLVQVQIFNASSPFEMIITDIELTSVNTATIKFAQNVPTGTSYNVIVIG